MEKIKFPFLENFDYHKGEGDKTPDEKSVRRLHRALSALPHDTRLILALHYFNGLTPAEIAEQMGISRRAVYGRMKRAREKLKKILKILL